MAAGIQEEQVVDQTGHLGEREVWMYVNPITGRYARLKKSDALAVFINERVGREYETKSKILENMIGHYLPREEMLQIAASVAGGAYVIIAEFGNL